MDLQGVRSKIERADKHIRELEAAQAAFFSLDTHRIVTHHNPATGRTKIVFESSKDTPPDINLIAGDVVHNLRTSLDHVMCGLVMALTPDVKLDNIHFPIRDHRNGVIAALSDAEKSGLGKSMMGTPLGRKIAGVILDEIQPYGTFQNPICALGKLDNIDKHRLLITVTSLATVSFTGTIGSMTFDNSGTISELGSNVAMFEFPANLEVKGKFQPTFEVLINEREFPKDQPLIPTLKNFFQVVVQAINAIDACITAHGRTP